MVRQNVLLGVPSAVAVMILFMAGCSEKPGLEQNPGKFVKGHVQTPEQKITHLITMLELDGISKPLRAARRLGKIGASAEKALPKLKEVSEKSETDAEVKQACLDAIDMINEALEGGSEE